MPVSAVVAVIGEGMLADFVCAELAVSHRIVRRRDFTQDVPKEAALAVVAHDAWHPGVHLAAEETLRPIGIPWLRGFVAFGEGVVGPLVRPDAPGCSRCADTRRLMAGRDRREMWELAEGLAAHGGPPRDAWASRAGLWQVARLLASEARVALQSEDGFNHGGSQCGSPQNDPERAGGTMFLINLRTLQSSRHFCLPDPLCPVCGRVPDDSEAAARIELRPRPKRSADSYRLRPMEELQRVLTKDYFDYRTGLINGKLLDLASPFADTSVNLPLLTEDETCAGRTHSYALSELTGILEGLERYCGVTPRGKRTVIRDSYRRLADRALCPAQVGLHAEEQYAQPDFPFRPFDSDLALDWVWGYSFLQERPILVPERLVYYSTGCGDGFVQETSNGCALGGSLEEAIFHGILEVVERDAFLLSWYAQLKLPRLDPDSAGDAELRLMVERSRAVAGFDVFLFNSTMEHGIPSIWALAKNRKGRGINLVCAAAAHPDPVRAAKSAIHEVSGLMLTLDEKFEANRGEAERMYRDPYRVRHMEDHSLLYGLPQAEERLGFLLDESRPLKTFAEEFGTRRNYADLTDELKSFIQVFRRLHLDVIVVDQSAPETLRNGLHCVKVLIPGMLPMTFGYRFTRLVGLERVLTVPAELGYAQKPLTFEQLNPHPHPFP